MAYYPITLTPDDNGTLLVTSPMFDELVTFGDDAADARHHAWSAVYVALADRMGRGEAIPAPLRDAPRDAPYVEVPLNIQMKLALYLALREQGKSRMDLMHALGWTQRESVDRLFRLHHHSRLEQYQAAFDALGLSQRFDLFPREAA